MIEACTMILGLGKRLSGGGGQRETDLCLEKIEGKRGKVLKN